MKKFSKKETMGLTTMESHCKLRLFCFDGVMKMEAKLERGDWEVRQ